MTRIAIIGNGLAGRLSALYFLRQIPGAEITLVDPDTPNKPIVGESTVEVTAQFLKSLGLGSYLEDNHKHKYGLTYYFRLPRDEMKPDAPEYVLHEAPGVVRLPAYNLNRHTFDEELSRRIAPHVTKITGKVTSVDFADAMSGEQTVHVATSDGDMLTLTADHVVDCSGRARVLTKQMDLHRDPPTQRSSYWFRTAGFDRSILMDARVVKPQHHTYESYYVTHHFYGKGYWIWVIPMESGTGEDMASIGITYRSDVAGEKAMNMDRLLEILDRDHPRVADLIRSGRKVDEARYFNYMYEASQYYDQKGRWFMVGDSGFAFDPANSFGIAYLGHEIPQVASMILKAQKGMLVPEYVTAMEDHVKAQLTLQDQLGERYAVMDDPIKIAWTLVFTNMSYFHILLPDYMSGAFLNAGTAKRLARALKRSDGMMLPPAYPFPEILDKLAMTDDPQEIIRRTPALYEQMIPFSYYRPDHINRGKLASTYLFKRGWLRNKALKLLGWWKMPELYGMAAKQYLMTVGDWLLSGLLALRPKLYDRISSTKPELKSAFDPEYSFLFPPEELAMMGKTDPVPQPVEEAEPAKPMQPAVA